jgi:hypothetical protein
VEHEISTTNVLHDKIYSSLCLKTGVKIKQERMAFLVGNEENSLFRPYTFDFIIFDDEFLFENLDCIELLCRFGLSEHDLTKIAFSKNSKKVEMIESNTTACSLS